MIDRHELAQLIHETSQGDERTISATGALIVASAIIESKWLAKRNADAIRNAADYMDIGNGYYQMLAVDDLYEKADYMDGTRP